MQDIDVSPVDAVEDDESTADATPTEDSDGAIDVDVVDDATEPSRTVDDDVALDGVDAPEYVLYGGKGGVGKTTMAAATALASASDGTRTLVVSTDPAHSLSDTLDVDVPAEPGRLREDVPLWGAEIDPEVAVEQGVDLFGAGSPPGDELGGARGGTGDTEPGGAGPMGGLGELLDGDDPMSMLGGTVPGADEAAAVQLLLQYLDDPRFERVVVDTAPTGHTLRLLELPEVMDSMVGRMLSIRERLSGFMDGMKGVFGGDTPDQGADVEELRELADRIEDLRDILQDPALTDFRVVMIPEAMSVHESERLIQQLDDYDIPNDTVVVNKVMESLADVTDDVDVTEFVTPDLEDCEFCQRRWDVQQDALARAQNVFRTHDVKRVPLFADDVTGDRMLHVVAHCLA